MPGWILSSIGATGTWWPGRGTSWTMLKGHTGMGSHRTTSDRPTRTAKWVCECLPGFRKPASVIRSPCSPSWVPCSGSPQLNLHSQIKMTGTLTWVKSCLGTLMRHRSLRNHKPRKFKKKLNKRQHTPTCWNLVPRNVLVLSWGHPS